jgi:hypothetical protein
MTNSKSAAFLQAFDDPAPEPAALPKPKPEPKPVVAPRAVRPAKAPSTSRVGLKHIGGYFDREDVEKIAILRARLGLDNSQLIRLAVEELFKKHSARRAFGDDR